jgi:hypothetical protein
MKSNAEWMLHFAFKLPFYLSAVLSLALEGDLQRGGMRKKNKTGSKWLSVEWDIEHLKQKSPTDP